MAGIGATDMRGANKQINVQVVAQDRASAVLNKIGQNAQRGLLLFATGIALKQVGSALESFGRKIEGVATATGKMAVDFQHGMSIVRTQTDLTDKQFADLTRRTLQVMRTVPQTADDIQKTLYEIFSSTSQGYKQAIANTKLYAQAATAGNTDILTSAKSVISEQNAFNLSSRTTRHLLDLQFQTVRFGRGTYEEFANAIGDVVPSARAAGQTLETMSGLFAFATRAGLSTSKAAISLARAMDLLVRPTVAAQLKQTLGIDIVDKATGQYKQFNVILDEMAAKLDHLSGPKRTKVLADIFGQGDIRALRFFKIAIPNIKQLDKLMQETGKNGGALSGAFAKVADTVSVKWAIMLNHIRAIGIEIANDLMPSVSKLVGWFAKIVDWFDKLSPKTKDLIAKILLLVGAFALVEGKMLKLTGTIIDLMAFTALAGKSFGWLAASVGSVIVVTGLLVVAAGLIIANWKKVGPFFIDLWGQIKDIAKSAFDAIKAWWDSNGQALINGIMDLAKSVGRFLVDAFKLVVDIGVPVAAAFLTIGKALLPLVGFIIDFVDAGVQFLDQLGVLKPLIYGLALAFGAWVVIEKVKTWWALLNTFLLKLWAGIGTTTAAIVGGTGVIDGAMATQTAAIGETAGAMKLYIANAQGMVVAEEEVAGGAVAAGGAGGMGAFGAGLASLFNPLTMVIAFAAGFIINLQEMHREAKINAKSIGDLATALETGATSVDDFNTAVNKSKMPDWWKSGVKGNLLPRAIQEAKDKLDAYKNSIVKTIGPLSDFNRKEYLHYIRTNNLGDAYFMLQQLYQAYIDSLSPGVRKMGSMSDELKNQKEKAKELGASLDDLKHKTDNLPSHKKIMISVDVQEARAGINLVGSWVNALVSKRYNIHIGATGPGIAWGGQLQHGFHGIVKEPTLFMVAEHGQAERVDVTPGMTSTSNRRSNGDGGSRIGQVHLHFHGMEKADVADAVSEWDWWQRTSGLG